MSGSNVDVDVLIVGAGPVGLMLANHLGLHGVTTVVLERNASTVHEPRAIGYDDETFRALQSVGLSDTFAEHVVPDIPIAVLNRRDRPLMTMHALNRPFGHSQFGTFYQPTLERILVDGTKRFDCVDVRFKHELLAFHQQDTTVTATVRAASGEKKTIRCGWLVGCDGGSSGVRESLGLRFEGSTYNERWLVVDCANDALQSQSVSFYTSGERPTLTMPAPDGRRRWEFFLHDGEDASDIASKESIERLLSKYHDPKLAQIERSTVYTFHARFAETFRRGRVLLAGDSAHVMPPFAGQGLNSGIRDAFNLGWKLALVTRGASSLTLLNSYERERRWHVKRMTQLAVAVGTVVMTLHPQKLIARDVLFAGLNASSRVRAFFRDGKLRQPPYLGRNGLYCRGRHTQAGRMLHQIDAQLPDGTSQPLDSVLGSGFAMVGINVDPLNLDDGWTQLGKRLGAKSVCIQTPGERPQSTNGDTLHVADLDGVFAGATYHRTPNLMIRPDRFVMAASTNRQRNKHASDMRSMLAM